MRFLACGWILAVAAGMGACSSTRTLEVEHATDLEEESANPLVVLDYFPADDVPGVPQNIQPYFVFNREVSSLDEVALLLGTSSGYQVPVSAELDFDGAGITFVPGTTVATSGTTRFSMSLESSPEDETVVISDFTTDFPAGLMFNMSSELKCEQFGGSGAQARLLNTYFTPGEYPLWILVARGVTESTTLPARVDLLMGPAYIRSNGKYRIYRHIGFSTVFRDVEIAADGSFIAPLEGEFLPLDTPDKVVLTYMVRPTLVGRFDFTSGPPRIRDMRLEGVFPSRSLLMLADASESYATAVNMVNLDEDLNGNGTNDAATFVITAQPTVITADQWDP